MFTFRFLYLMLLLAYRDEPGKHPSARFYSFLMSFMLMVPVLNAVQGLASQLLLGHWPQDPPQERSIAHMLEYFWPKIAIFLPLFYAIYASPRAKLDQTKFNAMYTNRVLPNFNAWRGYFVAALLVVLCGALWIQRPYPLIAALASILGILLMSLILRMRLLAHAA